MDAVISGLEPRMQTIIFGPADFIATINMRTVVVGEQPPGYDVGDAYHYVLMRILVAARANDLQAIDGPYLRSRTSTASAGWPAGHRHWASTASGCCTLARSTRPTRSTRQVQHDYDHAEMVLDAYDYSTSERAVCAAPSCSVTR